MSDPHFFEKQDLLGVRGNYLETTRYDALKKERMDCAVALFLSLLFVSLQLLKDV